jgi:hypothetical protein
MADHGWNADGAAGVVAAGNSNSDSSAGAAQTAAPNVVQFPGDWIGPLDELVPIGLDRAGQDHPRASSFWDGDATAVHEAVESVGPVGSPGPGVGSAGPGVGTEGQRVGSAGPGAARHQEPPSVTGVREWPGPRRRGPSWPLLAGVALAVLLSGLVVLWLSHGGRAPGESAPVTTRSAATVVSKGFVKPQSKTSSPDTKPLSRKATSKSHKLKPTSHKAKPAKATAKPATAGTVTNPVTFTSHVTVTPQAPVTHVPPPQHETAVTTPPPVVVQHVVAAPPKKPVTSHPTQRSHATQSASCAMSPDSGCLP